MSYDDKCHGREVRHLLKEPSEDTYVVFYTRHTDMSRVQKNMLVGYFKVGEHDKRSFKASETVLLPKSKCVPIDYTGRGVPVSGGHSRAEKPVTEFLQQCITRRAEDISHLYHSQTAFIMKKLTTVSGQQWLVNTCNACAHAHNCYWGQSRDKEAALKRYELKSTC